MIKPLFDNVLLKKIEVEKATTSGIVLASKEDTSNIGIVSAGSKVVFSDKYKKVDFEGQEYYLVNEEEVLAVIED